MSLPDLVFLLGPVGAVVLVPLAMAVLAVRRQPRWAIWPGICLAIIVSAAWLGYWYLWGRGFDSADAFQPGPATVSSGLGVTMTVAAVGTAALTGSRQPPCSHGDARAKRGEGGRLLSS